jgi:predicted RNase H-like HicB family nuclease
MFSILDLSGAATTRWDPERSQRVRDAHSFLSAEGFSARIMVLAIELDREVDGRYIAEVPELRGVIVYGDTEDAAIENAKALALHVLADRIEHGEALPSGAGKLEELHFSRSAA